MLHFWVSMCQVAGLTAESAFELYLAKNKLNHSRQDSSYNEGTYDKFEDCVEDNKQLFD